MEFALLLEDDDGGGGEGFGDRGDVESRRHGVDDPEFVVGATVAFACEDSCVSGDEDAAAEVAHLQVGLNEAVDLIDWRRLA